MSPAEAFVVLGLNMTATAEEVKKAWRVACMKHHPDRGGNQHDFLQAKEAFSICSMHVSSQTCPRCQGTGRLWIQVGVKRMSIRCKCVLKGAFIK